MASTEQPDGGPAAEIEINLDVHGFERDEDAPSHVTGELTQAVTGYYLLEFEDDTGERWRVELSVDPNGELQAREVYRNGQLEASSAIEGVQNADDLPRWARFVIKHVNGEVVQA